MGETTTGPRPRTTVSGAGREYLPGMSRAWLLPLYDPMTRLMGVERIHRRLLDQAALRPGQTVLEIGCGTGNLLLAAKETQPAATAVGVDPDLAALARADRKARRRGLAVQLDRGHAEELPYADDSVDVVLSSFMLHHVPADQQEAAVREVVRVLRPGGALHLVDIAGDEHGHDHAHRGHRGHQHSLARHVVASLPDLLRRAGFGEVTETGSGTHRWVGRFSYLRATP
ncbi:class I SAM-dependent methyltransferase [Geodermatophilus sabuli]|uniref:Methyltransferase domain-containing protein n=1 Tax=Geodermatophilus sabuli TaxID=1564158 RepID=A0A285EFN4_9ACTN|nr:class I SAM-dependent methyltransferase [Geodermatophilus sabuli]MBB3082955.1 ubiquinone/menaquinone biosynthesis C-methylase UbiE [Geodermatophilus sabuli]SNX97952.1 Methyltransferase domain-containing protein [Geodermatophilus sabuli]